eukprot:507802-Pelagomonas_calceolata.AAC.7
MHAEALALVLACTGTGTGTGTGMHWHWHWHWSKSQRNAQRRTGWMQCLNGTGWDAFCALASAK